MEDENLKAKLAERKEFNVKKRKGPGRPPKKEIKSKTKGSRGQVGRPKGDAAIMNDYKARMLASPKSKLVLETIFDAALNDEHKNQSAAWKLIVDRIMPVGMFEKDVMQTGGRNAIQINITGLGASVEPDNEPDIIEGEYSSSE